MYADAIFSIHNGFLLLICGLLSLIVPFGWAQQRSNKPDEFSCPEEFGYYPHPTDCTQYFVCVFGGALLESCTGGLMYSHDLQTCDWPRNVGCGVSTAASTKNEKSVVGPVSGIANPSSHRQTTTSWKQEVFEPENEEIPDRHLYEEEDLGPAEEIENDRQQRVYRGQPPTLGQVARDRDGIIRHANALQTSNGLEKVKPITIVSFGSHQQSLSTNKLTNFSVLHTEHLPHIRRLLDVAKKNEASPLETNRIKRNANISREPKNETRTTNETIRSTGGYALRFRPLRNNETNSDANVNFVNGSLKQHQQQTVATSDIRSQYSAPNANSFRYTPSLIRLPLTSSPRSRNKISYRDNVPFTTVTTPRITNGNSNPLTSGSVHVNSYSNAVDDSMVVTDFTIVNIAPKDDRRTQSAFPSPPVAHHQHQNPWPDRVLHLQKLPLPLPLPIPPPPPPPLPPSTASFNEPLAPYHSQLHPAQVFNNVNRMSGYGGPLASPSYYYPTSFHNFYQTPDVSLVTLSYPKKENNADSNSKKELKNETNASSSSTLPASTVAETTMTTMLTSTVAVAVAKTKTGLGKHSTDMDESRNNNETVVGDATDNVKSNNNKKKSKVSAINDEFDEDEFGVPEESVDEDRENENAEMDGFGKTNFYDESDSSNEASTFNKTVDDALASATNNTNKDLRDKLNEHGENEEFLLEDNKSADNRSEEEEESKDENEQDEEEEAEEAKDNDGDNDDNDDEERRETLNESTMSEDSQADEEEAEAAEGEGKDEKTDKSSAIRPATSYYNRYIMQEDDEDDENSFSKFDFNDFLSDLSKPSSSTGGRIHFASNSSAKNVTNELLEAMKPKKETKRNSDDDENAFEKFNIKDSPSSQPQPHISRKQDRIIHLFKRDKAPSRPFRLLQSTAPQRLVPLAVVHTYKPANYSYPPRRRPKKPSTKNVFDDPIDFHRLYLGNGGNNKDTSPFPKFEFPTYERPSLLGNGPDRPPGSSSRYCPHGECSNDENDDRDRRPINEENEQATREGEGDGDDEDDEDATGNAEYYDEYGDDHIEQPLTDPIPPTVPTRLINIDNELFENDEKESESEDEEEEEPDEDKENGEKGREAEEGDDQNASQQHEGGDENDEEDDDAKRESLDDDSENEEQIDDDEGDGAQDDENNEDDEAMAEGGEGEEHEQNEEEDRPPESSDAKVTADQEEDDGDASVNSPKGETAASVTRKLKKPHTRLAGFVSSTTKNSLTDQLMTPHRQNRYLESPSTRLNNEVAQRPAPPSTTTTTPTKVMPKAASFSDTRSRLTLPSTAAAAAVMATTMTVVLKRDTTMAPSPTELDDRVKKSKPSKSVTVSQLNAKKKSNSPSPPNLYLSIRPNVLLTYPYNSTAPPHRNNFNGKLNVQHQAKNKYKMSDGNGFQMQKPSTSQRPLSSVPSYIVEESLSSVPTTSKSIYNVTKIDPSFYNVYDRNQDLYRNHNIEHYQKHRKPQLDYQGLQDSHRLQPQPSHTLNSPTIYTNQDYRTQTVIDADSQQSDKLISNKLFVDSYTEASVKQQNENSPFTFPYVSRIIRVNLPVVELRNGKLTNLTYDNKFHVKNGPTATSVQPEKRLVTNVEYEKVKSEELEFHTEDPLVGETSNLLKTTSYIRKFSPTVPVPVTTSKFPFRFITTTISTTPKTEYAFVSQNFPFHDGFRIIVEPVASKNATLKINAPNADHGKRYTTTKVAIEKFTNANRFATANATTLPQQSKSKAQIVNPTTVATTTTTNTKSITHSAPAADNEKLYNRRFYIPKTNSLERKLHFGPASSTTDSATIPTTGSFRSTKPTTKLANAYSENVRSTSISTQKIPSKNELLYYDDDDDDNNNDNDDDDDVEEYDDDVDQNVDNYIDNKIVDYSSTIRNNVNAFKSTINVSLENAPPTLVKTSHGNITTSTTFHNSASSPAQHNPYEFVKNRLKETQINAKRTDRPKETNAAERCPQCNEKPGRNRGSVTYTTGGTEYDGVTGVGGRTRPTLKPSTSIVSKSTDVVDIYRHPPKRPDSVYPTPQADKVAAKCRKDICLLPDCSCGGKDIPGDLTPEETPQLVLLTFDDSVNELNRGLYVDLFEKGRVNPNGCPIAATFYVSHEWTDYSMVQNLYAAGHEIASHSVSHSFGEQFSQRKWTKEIVGQREILAAYGGVRQEDIRGMRAPFLAVGGNKMFKMLYDANFTYDSSMPIYENRPPSWPYTLDYKLFHDCMIPPCPTRSYPGVWEIPMVMWQDLNGGRCSMGDACSNPPTADGVYKMLIKNFERHFTTNRAPFGLFYHSSWFTQPHHKDGFLAFLDTIVNMPEVWIVTNWQVIQWARDPTPLSRLNNFSPFNCDYPERPRRCNNAKVCNLWHKSGVRYLKTCQTCPDVYPWTGKTGVKNSRIDIEETTSAE